MSPTTRSCIRPDLDRFRRGLPAQPIARILSKGYFRRHVRHDRCRRDPGERAGVPPAAGPSRAGRPRPPGAAGDHGAAHGVRAADRHRAGRPARRDTGQLLVAPAQARRAPLRRGGGRRHRPPTPVAGPLVGLAWDETDASPSEVRAGRALEQMLLERQVTRFHQARAQLHDDGDEDWADAAQATQAASWLTLDELDELNTEIRSRPRAVRRPPHRPLPAPRRAHGCASSSRGGRPCSCPASRRRPTRSRARPGRG